ncbi:hypothetical protein Tsubulata_044904 [Turnera subulata]|uniref:Uncharacterized protein n=1 Tax=Turnera subulata TaxID=218843 RepID=A0A9Q0J0P6_9ROSI|nr:hypothetical protein Tsubulata_044904 [Turnera subulata]
MFSLNLSTYQEQNTEVVSGFQMRNQRIREELIKSSPPCSTNRSSLQKLAGIFGSDHLKFGGSGTLIELPKVKQARNF